MAFPVTLSGPAEKPVSVDYQTADGSADAGRDYRAKSGTLTIPASETSGVVEVRVLSDKVREDNERMSLSLASPGYGTIADGTATGTIVNDDTEVGLKLTQATERKVRATVDTAPAAPGAQVKIYRMVGGEGRLLFTGELNDLGRISRVLEQRYQSGAEPKLYSTVRTDHGVYRSETERLTIR